LIVIYILKNYDYDPNVGVYVCDYFSFVATAVVETAPPNDIALSDVPHPVGYALAWFATGVVA